MQVNPEDGPPEIYVTLSGPRMTDFENLDWANAMYAVGHVTVIFTVTST